MYQLRSKDYDFGGFGADTLRKMFARPRVSDIDAVWAAVDQIPEYEMPSPRMCGHFVSDYGA